MSTDVASSEDADYAKQLMLVTVVWLVFIFGSGLILILLLPE